MIYKTLSFPYWVLNGFILDCIVILKNLNKIMHRNLKNIVDLINLKIYFYLSARITDIFQGRVVQKNEVELNGK